jgi:hypothetical protein
MAKVTRLANLAMAASELRAAKTADERRGGLLASSGSRFPRIRQRV